MAKLDKQTWTVAASGTVTVTYGIFWDEAGPFASQLNSEHAFLNSAMLLMYVPDRRAEDTKIEFEDVPEGWRVAHLFQGGATQPYGGDPGREAAYVDDVLTRRVAN